MPRKTELRSSSLHVTAEGGVGAVDRAISLLDVFTPDHPVLSLAELADGSQQYKSTVSRILASLTHAQVVRRLPDGRYSLGSAISRLHAVYALSFSMESVLLPVLQQLVETTRETAAFYVRQGSKRLCLCGVDSPQTIRDHLQVGALLPLGNGAVGTMFSVFGDAAVRSRKPAHDELAIAPCDITPEVAAIAAPVFATGDALAGVVSLTMPSMRLQRAHAEAVRAAARRLTGEFTGRNAAAA